MRQLSIDKRQNQNYARTHQGGALHLCQGQDRHLTMVDLKCITVKKKFLI